MGRTSNISSGWDAVEVDASSADVVLQAGCRGLYVGVPGDVRVEMESGNVVTFTDLGGSLAIQVTTVFTSGTTATNIVALY